MIREKRRWSKREMYYLLALLNRYMFTMLFWKDDLTVPKDREDLPAKWRGKQVVTREQRLMMLDRAKRKQFCTARKVFKTGVLESMYFHYPLMNLLRDRQTEGMFYVPREHHRDPVIGRVKRKANRVPLFALIKDSFNEGKQEFRFKTNFVWYNRIEGNPANAGQNMVGPRTSVMLGDEGAYGNDAAYAERLNTALPDADWIWAGVPNGMRDTKFYRISETSEGEGWSRHRYDIRANPIYHSRWAWERLVDEHGGVNTQSFITQVLGQWGEATVASFAVIPHVSWGPFTRIELTGDDIAEAAQELAVVLNMRVPEGAEEFIVAGDLGYSPSPTILCIAYLKDGVWWQMATVEMLLANSVQQARVIDTICTQVLPKRPIRGCLDAHGRGAGILDNLHHMPEFDNAYYRERFIDAGFAGSMPDERIKVHRRCGQRVREGGDGLWFCDQCREVISDPKQIKPAQIPTKQFLTVSLKEAFMHGQAHIDLMAEEGHGAN